jgi:GNAT superfamily N-acetyltransferase
LTRLKDNSAYIFLCAVENERLIGYVSGIVCEDLYGDCEPFLLIENLVVEETERQNEIRGALCAELMNCAKLKGCTLTAFVTEKSKEKAGEFYESIGFNLAGYIGSKNRIND